MERNKNILSQAWSVTKSVFKKIHAGFKSITGKINALVDGDEIKSSNTDNVVNSNETVIVGTWRLAIKDETGKVVYNEPLIFNRPNEEDPTISYPKIIGRYDSDYYEKIGETFDPKYDINIRSSWKGANHVHRTHAYLVYHKEDKTITMHAFERDSTADNGIFDENKREVTSLTIKDDTKVWLGPSITLYFYKPNNIVNEDTSKKEVRDIDDHTTVKHPGRMPGRR